VEQIVSDYSHYQDNYKCSSQLLLSAKEKFDSCFSIAGDDDENLQQRLHSLLVLMKFEIIDYF